MTQLFINPDRLVEFLSALLEKLAAPGARAALWFDRPVILPISAESIGGTSPFPGSDSILAGEGYLIHLTKSNADRLAAFFANNMDSLSALVHLELESAGQLQFRSYDYFSINLPSSALDSQWLSALNIRGIIVKE